MSYRKITAMAKLPISYYPAEVLRQKSKKVSRFDMSLRKFAKDMLETMYALNGVGLAAPQVGSNKRLMVIDISEEDEPRKPIVFINPEIIASEGEMYGTEGCLSFPGVFFEVKRFSKITVKFQNLAGKDMRLTAQDNLLCRAIQHEMDHLDGTLFIDKALSKEEADGELIKNGFLGQATEVPQQEHSPESQEAPKNPKHNERQLVG